MTYEMRNTAHMTGDHRNEPGRMSPVKVTFPTSIQKGKSAVFFFRPKHQT
jgi:hypothetical protein